MACYDTEENRRSEYTELTLESLFSSVDWSKHRLIIIDNGSCERTKVFLSSGEWYSLIINPENLGTARAINQGLQLRQPGEFCIKIDNDCVVNQSGWVDEMEEAVNREPSIGVLGLKRKDLIQTQWHVDPNFRSEGVMLPHEPGQRWIWVEKTNDVMGTCTMLNPAMLDKVGYYYQGDWKYGMDDNLMNLRCHIAGFSTCFLPHIDIEHIDTGQNPYTQEKHKLASEVWARYIEIHNEFVEGKRDIYYDGAGI